MDKSTLLMGAVLGFVRNPCAAAPFFKKGEKRGDESVGLNTVLLNAGDRRRSRGVDVGSGEQKGKAHAETVSS